MIAWKSIGKSIILLSLWGGFLGALTGFLFSYPWWYMAVGEAELEGQSYFPYWSKEVVFYTLGNFGIGLFVCAALFLVLLVKFGSNWTAYAKRGFGLVEFLLTTIIAWWPYFITGIDGPKSGPPDSPLVQLLTLIGFATAASLPVLLVAELIAVFGGSLLVKVLCPEKS